MEDSENQQIAVRQEKKVHNRECRLGDGDNQPLRYFIVEIVVFVPTYIILIGLGIFGIHASIPRRNLSLGKIVSCIFLVLLIIFMIICCLFMIYGYGLLIANRIRRYLEDRNAISGRLEPEV